MTYKPVGVDENSKFPPRVQDVLDSSFISQSLAQVGLDDDGKPYISDTIAFQDAVAVHIDDNGQPYYEVD